MLNNISFLPDQTLFQQQKKSFRHHFDNFPNQPWIPDIECFSFLHSSPVFPLPELLHDPSDFSLPDSYWNKHR